MRFEKVFKKSDFKEKDLDTIKSMIFPKSPIYHLAKKPT